MDKKKQLYIIIGFLLIVLAVYANADIEIYHEFVDTNIFVNLPADCPLGYYLYGFNSDGTVDCRADVGGIAGGAVYTGVAPIVVDNDTNKISLNVSPTDDWNGLFDGQEGSYYLDDTTISCDNNSLCTLLSSTLSGAIPSPLYINCDNNANCTITGDITGAIGYQADTNWETSWSIFDANMQHYYLEDLNDSIKDYHIDWGIGANQVDGNDMFVLQSTETLDQFLMEVIPSGVMQDINVSDDGGLNFSWTAGEVHVNGVVIETDSGSDTAADNDRTYLYATTPTGSTLQTSTTYPTGDYALVATIDAYSGDIEHIYQRNIIGEIYEDIETHIELVHADIVSSGLLVAEDTDATLANDFTISAGTYYHEGLDRHDVSLLYSSGSGHDTNKVDIFYHSGGAWTIKTSYGVDFDYYDNGTNKTAVTTAKWYCAWIFVVDDNIMEYVYPQQEHSKETGALQEAITYPPYHSEYAVPLAKFIFRGGQSSFGNKAYFADIRPVHLKGTAGEIVYAVQDLWSTIQADSGSATANLTYDTLTIAGGTNVTTSITGDTLTIDSTAAGIDTNVWNEGYAFDQNVAIASSPTFANLIVNNDFNAGESGSYPLRFNSTWGRLGLLGGTASGLASMAIMPTATANSAYSTAIGFGTSTTGDHSIAMGYNSQTHSNYAMSFGRDSSATGMESVAIGYDANANAPGTGCIAIGAYAYCNVDNTVTLNRDVNVGRNLNVGNDANVYGKMCFDGTDCIDAWADVNYAAIDTNYQTAGYDFANYVLGSTFNAAFPVADGNFDKTGNWTGTFDGQEGTYYLDWGNVTNKDWWVASNPDTNIPNTSCDDNSLCKFTGEIDTTQPAQVQDLNVTEDLNVGGDITVDLNITSGGTTGEIVIAGDENRIYIGNTPGLMACIEIVDQNVLIGFC